MEGRCSSHEKIDTLYVENHPFFVQLPEGASPARSSEGHRYDGAIARGAWVDASELKAGYRLLNDDGSWAVVGGVTVTQAPLTAYNLTVNGMHTYFVTGNADAKPVWVHNDCLIDVPAGSIDLGGGNYRTPNGEVATRAADGRFYIIKGPSQSPIWQGLKNVTLRWEPPCCARWSG